MKFLPPDHPFIVAVRNADLAKVKKLASGDSSLVTFQVCGDISLKGQVRRDGGYVEVLDDAPERAGPLRAFAKYLPDQEELESQAVSEMIDSDSAEAIRLLARMADLGGQPPFSALVRGSFDDLAIETVTHRQRRKPA